MSTPGWQPSPASPKRFSRVHLVRTNKLKQAPRKNHWAVNFSLAIGLVLVLIGAAAQIPYTFGERASYTVTEGEIVEQSAEKSKRSKYSSPYRSYRSYRSNTYRDIICKAKVSFVANGSTYKNNAADLDNKCDYSNGDKIKVAYDPEDIPGTLTTKVYPYNLYPVAMMFVGGGVAVGGGAWLISVFSHKNRKKKRNR